MAGHPADGKNYGKSEQHPGDFTTTLHDLICLRSAHHRVLMMERTGLQNNDSILLYVLYIYSHTHYMKN